MDNDDYVAADAAYAADMRVLYISWTIVLGQLPIVITMPELPLAVKAQTVVMAVDRAISAVWDEPVDEDTRVHIRGGLISWLASLDLYGRYMISREQWRRDAAMINYAGSRAAAAIATMLVMGITDTD